MLGVWRLSVLCLRFSVPSRPCFRSLSTPPTEDWWSKYNFKSGEPFEFHAEMTDLVEAIANAKEHNLHTLDSSSTPLKAFELPNCSFPFKGFGPQVLFVRHFYDTLFTKIRSLERTVLIGNPRLGKSMFQFYYLSRIFNHGVFGSLPPNHLGLTKVEFVIRQLGADEVEIYNVDQKEVVSSPKVPVAGLFRVFDPSTTLYLVEPGAYKGEPYYLNLKCQALATVSPDERRYKEFCKNGAVKLYFPVWTLADLKSAGRYLRDRDLLPQTPFYSEKSIEARYEQFGGIFQHIFVNSPQEAEALLAQRKELMTKPNLDVFLVNGNIESPLVSHLIMQYSNIPMVGENSFQTREFAFVSKGVKKEVMNLIWGLKLDEQIQMLIQNDKRPYSTINSQEIYENVVPQLLLIGTKGWGQRSINNQVYESLGLTMTRIVQCTKLPNFDEMEENVIYKPMQQNYPAIDFQFRLNQRVYGVDVT